MRSVREGYNYPVQTDQGQTSLLRRVLQWSEGCTRVRWVCRIEANSISSAGINLSSRPRSAHFVNQWKIRRLIQWEENLCESADFHKIVLIIGRGFGSRFGVNPVADPSVNSWGLTVPTLEMHFSQPVILGCPGFLPIESNLSGAVPGWPLYNFLVRSRLLCPAPGRRGQASVDWL